MIESILLSYGNAMGCGWARQRHKALEACRRQRKVQIIATEIKRPLPFVHKTSRQEPYCHCVTEPTQVQNDPQEKQVENQARKEHNNQ
jgi:hypothetical protein